MAQPVASEQDRREAQIAAAQIALLREKTNPKCGWCKGLGCQPSISVADSKVSVIDGQKVFVIKALDCHACKGAGR